MGSKNTASEPRRLGIPLGIAIMAVPLVFGWFPFLPGYSKSTRRVAAAWMAYSLGLAFMNVASTYYY